MHTQDRGGGRGGGGGGDRRGGGGGGRHPPPTVFPNSGPGPDIKKADHKWEIGQVKDEDAKLMRVVKGCVSYPTTYFMLSLTSARLVSLRNPTCGSGLRALDKGNTSSIPRLTICVRVFPIKTNSVLYGCGCTRQDFEQDHS